jgi:hypothetical protein
MGVLSWQRDWWENTELNLRLNTAEALAEQEKVSDPYRGIHFSFYEADWCGQNALEIRRNIQRISLLCNINTKFLTKVIQMNQHKTMFSFNIPMETKMIFQSLCRSKCIGMTSFLNSCIQKFIEENRSESSKINTYQHDDFITDVYTND